MTKEQVNALKEFVFWALQEFKNSDMKGSSHVQAKAVELGILVPHTFDKPCGDFCQCQDYYGSDVFPVTCYRYAEYF